MPNFVITVDNKNLDHIVTYLTLEDTIHLGSPLTESNSTEKIINAYPLNL